MLFTPARSTLIGSRNEGDGSSVLRIQSSEHDYCVIHGPFPLHLKALLLDHSV